MKNANLIIKKLPENGFNVPSLQIKRNSGESLGLILSSIEFIPVNDVSLYSSEMATITNVMENFWFFWENVK